MAMSARRDEAMAMPRDTCDDRSCLCQMAYDIRQSPATLAAGATQRHCADAHQASILSRLDG